MSNQKEDEIRLPAAHPGTLLDRDQDGQADVTTSGGTVRQKTGPQGFNRRWRGQNPAATPPATP